LKQSIAVTLVASMILTMPGTTAWANTSLPQGATTGKQSPDVSQKSVVPPSVATAQNTQSIPTNLQEVSALLQMGAAVATLSTRQAMYSSPAQQAALTDGVYAGAFRNVTPNVQTDVIGTMNGNPVTVADMGPGGKYAFGVDWQDFNAKVTMQSMEMLKNSNANDSLSQIQQMGFDSQQGDNLQKLCDSFKCSGNAGVQVTVPKVQEEIDALTKEYQSVVFAANNVSVYLEARITTLKNLLAKKYGDPQPGSTDIMSENGYGTVGLDTLISNLVKSRNQIQAQLNQSGLTHQTLADVNALQQKCNAINRELDGAVATPCSVFGATGLHIQIPGKTPLPDPASQPGAAKGLYAIQKDLNQQEESEEANLNTLRTNFLNPVRTAMQNDPRLADMKSEVNFALGQAYDPRDKSDKPKTITYAEALQYELSQMTKSDSGGKSGSTAVSATAGASGGTSAGSTSGGAAAAAKAGTPAPNSKFDNIAIRVQQYGADLQALNLAQPKTLNLANILGKTYDPTLAARKTSDALEAKVKQYSKAADDQMMVPYANQGEDSALKHSKDIIDVREQAKDIKRQLQARIKEFSDIADQLTKTHDPKALTEAVAKMMCGNATDKTCVANNIQIISQPTFVGKDGKTYFNSNYIPPQYLSLAFNAYGSVYEYGGLGAWQNYERYQEAQKTAGANAILTAATGVTLPVSSPDPSTFKSWFFAQYDESVKGSLAASFTNYENDWRPTLEEQANDRMAAQNSLATANRALGTLQEFAGREWLTYMPPPPPPMPLLQDGQPAQMFRSPLDNPQVTLLMENLKEHPLDTLSMIGTQIWKNFEAHPFNTVAGVGGALLGAALMPETAGFSTPLVAGGLGLAGVGILGCGLDAMTDGKSFGSGALSGGVSTLSGFMLTVPMSAVVSAGGKFGNMVLRAADWTGNAIIRPAADFIGVGGETINALNIFANDARIAEAVAGGEFVSAMEAGESFAAAARAAPGFGEMMPGLRMFVSAPSEIFQGTKLADIGSAIYEGVGKGATSAWKWTQTIAPLPAQWATEAGQFSLEAGRALGALAADGAKSVGSYLSYTVPISLRLYGLGTVMDGSLTPTGMMGALTSPWQFGVGAVTYALGSAPFGNVGMRAAGLQAMINNETASALIGTSGVQKLAGAIDSTAYKEGTSLGYFGKDKGWAPVQKQLDNWAFSTNAPSGAWEVSGAVKTLMTFGDVASFGVGAKIVGGVATRLLGANWVADGASIFAMQAPMLDFYGQQVKNFDNLLHNKTYSLGHYAYDVGSFALGVGAARMAGPLPTGEGAEAPSVFAASMKEAAKMVTMGALGQVVGESAVVYGGAFGLPVYEAGHGAYTMEMRDRTVADLTLLTNDVNARTNPFSNYEPLSDARRSELLSSISDSLSLRDGKFFVNGVAVPENLVPAIKDMWDSNQGSLSVAPSDAARLGDGKWFHSNEDTAIATELHQLFQERLGDVETLTGQQTSFDFGPAPEPASRTAPESITVPGAPLESPASPESVGPMVMHQLELTFDIPAEETGASHPSSAERGAEAGPAHLFENAGIPNAEDVSSQVVSLLRGRGFTVGVDVTEGDLSRAIAGNSDAESIARNALENMMRREMAAEEQGPTVRPEEARPPEVDSRTDLVPVAQSNGESGSSERSAPSQAELNDAAKFWRALEREATDLPPAEPPAQHVAPASEEGTVIDHPEEVAVAEEVRAPKAEPSESEVAAKELARKAAAAHTEELWARRSGDIQGAEAARADRMLALTQRDVVLGEGRVEAVTKVADSAEHSAVPNFELEKEAALRVVKTDSGLTIEDLERGIETHKRVGEVDTPEVKKLMDQLEALNKKAEAAAQDAIDKAAAKLEVQALRAESIAQTGHDLSARDLAKAKGSDLTKAEEEALASIRAQRETAQKAGNSFDVTDKIDAAQKRIEKAVETTHEDLAASNNARDAKSGLYQDLRDAIRAASDPEISAKERRALQVKANDIRAKIEQFDLKAQGDSLARQISLLEEKGSDKGVLKLNALSPRDALDLAQLRLQKAQADFALEMLSAKGLDRAHLMGTAAKEAETLGHAVQRAQKDFLISEVQKNVTAISNDLDAMKLKVDGMRKDQAAANQVLETIRNQIRDNNAKIADATTDSDRILLLAKNRALLDLARNISEGKGSAETLAAVTAASEHPADDIVSFQTVSDPVGDYISKQVATTLDGEVQRLSEQFRQAKESKQEFNFTLDSKKMDTVFKDLQEKIAGRIEDVNFQVKIIAAAQSHLLARIDVLSADTGFGRVLAGSSYKSSANALKDVYSKQTEGILTKGMGAENAAKVGHMEQPVAEKVIQELYWDLNKTLFKDKGGFTFMDQTQRALNLEAEKLLGKGKGFNDLSNQQKESVRKEVTDLYGYGKSVDALTQEQRNLQWSAAKGTAQYESLEALLMGKSLNLETSGGKSLLAAMYAVSMDGQVTYVGPTEALSKKLIESDEVKGVLMRSLIEQVGTAKGRNVYDVDKLYKAYNDGTDKEGLLNALRDEKGLLVMSRQTHGFVYLQTQSDGRLLDAWNALGREGTPTRLLADEVHNLATPMNFIMSNASNATLSATSAEWIKAKAIADVFNSGDLTRIDFQSKDSYSKFWEMDNVKVNGKGWWYDPNTGTAYLTDAAMDHITEQVKSAIKDAGYEGVKGFEVTTADVVSFAKGWGQADYGNFEGKPVGAVIDEVTEGGVSKMKVIPVDADSRRQDNMTYHDKIYAAGFAFYAEKNGLVTGMLDSDGRPVSLRVAAQPTMVHVSDTRMQVAESQAMARYDTILGMTGTSEGVRELLRNKISFDVQTVSSAKDRPLNTWQLTKDSPASAIQRVKAEMGEPEINAIADKIETFLSDKKGDAFASNAPFENIRRSLLYGLTDAEQTMLVKALEAKNISFALVGAEVLSDEVARAPITGEAYYDATKKAYQEAYKDAKAEGLSDEAATQKALLHAQSIPKPPQVVILTTDTGIEGINWRGEYAEIGDVSGLRTSKYKQLENRVERTGGDGPFAAERYFFIRESKVDALLGKLEASPSQQEALLNGEAWKSPNLNEKITFKDADGNTVTVKVKDLMAKHLAMSREDYQKAIVSDPGIFKERAVLLQNHPGLAEIDGKLYDMKDVLKSYLDSKTVGGKPVSSEQLALLAMHYRETIEMTNGLKGEAREAFSKTMVLDPLQKLYNVALKREAMMKDMYETTGSAFAKAEMAKASDYREAVEKAIQKATNPESKDGSYKPENKKTTAEETLLQMFESERASALKVLGELQKSVPFADVRDEIGRFVDQLSGVKTKSIDAADVKFNAGDVLTVTDAVAYAKKLAKSMLPLETTQDSASTKAMKSATRLIQDLQPPKTSGEASPPRSGGDDGTGMGGRGRMAPRDAPRENIPMSGGRDTSSRIYGDLSQPRIVPGQAPSTLPTAQARSSVGLLGEPATSAPQVAGRIDLPDTQTSPATLSAPSRMLTVADLYTMRNEAVQAFRQSNVDVPPLIAAIAGATSLKEVAKILYQQAGVQVPALTGIPIGSVSQWWNAGVKNENGVVRQAWQVFTQAATEQSRQGAAIAQSALGRNPLTFMKGMLISATSPLRGAVGGVATLLPQRINAANQAAVLVKAAGNPGSVNVLPLLESLAKKSSAAVIQVLTLAKIHETALEASAREKNSAAALKVQKETIEKLTNIRKLAQTAPPQFLSGATLKIRRARQSNGDYVARVSFDPASEVDAVQVLMLADHSRRTADSKTNIYLDPSSQNGLAPIMAEIGKANEQGAQVYLVDGQGMAHRVNSKGQDMEAAHPAPVINVLPHTRIANLYHNWFDGSRGPVFDLGKFAALQKQITAAQDAGDWGEMMSLQEKLKAEVGQMERSAPYIQKAVERGIVHVLPSTRGLLYEITRAESEAEIQSAVENHFALSPLERGQILHKHLSDYAASQSASESIQPVVGHVVWNSNNARLDAIRVLEQMAQATGVRLQFRPKVQAMVNQVIAQLQGMENAPPAQVRKIVQQAVRDFEKAQKSAVAVRGVKSDWNLFKTRLDQSLNESVPLNGATVSLQKAIKAAADKAKATAKTPLVLVLPEDVPAGMTVEDFRQAAKLAARQVNVHTAEFKTSDEWARAEKDIKMAETRARAGAVLELRSFASGSSLASPAQLKQAASALGLVAATTVLPAGHWVSTVIQGLAALPQAIQTYKETKNLTSKGVRKNPLAMLQKPKSQNIVLPGWAKWTGTALLAGAGVLFLHVPVAAGALVMLFFKAQAAMTLVDFGLGAARHLRNERNPVSSGDSDDLIAPVLPIAPARVMTSGRTLLAGTAIAVVGGLALFMGAPPLMVVGSMVMMYAGLGVLLHNNKGFDDKAQSFTGIEQGISMTAPGAPVAPASFEASPANPIEALVPAGSQTAEDSARPRFSIFRFPLLKPVAATLGALITLGGNLRAADGSVLHSAQGMDPVYTGFVVLFLAASWYFRDAIVENGRRIAANAQTLTCA